MRRGSNHIANRLGSKQIIFHVSGGTKKTWETGGIGGGRTGAASIGEELLGPGTLVSLKWVKAALTAKRNQGTEKPGKKTHQKKTRQDLNGKFIFMI